MCAMAQWAWHTFVTNVIKCFSTPSLVKKILLCKCFPLTYVSVLIRYGTNTIKPDSWSFVPLLIISKIRLPYGM